jgi:hypothetical protein
MSTPEKSPSPFQVARQKHTRQMTILVLFILAMLVLSWFIWQLAGKPEGMKGNSTTGGVQTTSSMTSLPSGIKETPALTFTATQNVPPTPANTVIVPNRPWEPVSSSYFRSAADFQNEWQNLTALGFVYNLEPYLNLPALHLSFTDPIWVKTLDQEGNWLDELRDMQMEANLAFENGHEKVVLAVRYIDEDNYYGLILNQKRWSLVKIVNGISTELASGETTHTLANGGWGWYRIGCIENQLFVWDENNEIAAISDTSLSLGGAAIGFLPDANSGKVYLYYYRLMARSSD